MCCSFSFIVFRCRFFNWNSYKWGIIAMIIPRIPKNIAQPLKFACCPLLFILTNLQISKGLGDFKSLGSKNYATLTDENENLTHEDFLKVSSCLTSFGLSTQIYKKNDLALPTFLVKDTFFPNSLS